jgi:hypothetical protein
MLTLRYQNWDQAIENGPLSKGGEPKNRPLMINV